MVGADGRRLSHQFEERELADQFIAVIQQKIATVIHTTETACEAWVTELRTRRRSERTIEGYEHAIRLFWPNARPLASLTPKNCAARYDALRAATRPDGTPRYSVDTHRNALKQCRTFLEWCVGKSWLRANPLKDVRGVGKRRRGKPQLRLDEARAFYAHAIERAGQGDTGAVAALMCLLLTLRSESEALAVVARDIDDDGRLLWIDDAKTEAGRRVEEVPEDLRGPLKAIAAGKAGDTPLFRRRDRKWLWDEVQRLCTEAGIATHVSPHGLRGLHATLARRAGATSQLVAAALGHATARVTEEHYVDQAEVRGEERQRTLQVLRGGRS